MAEIVDRRIGELTELLERERTLRSILQRRCEQLEDSLKRAYKFAADNYARPPAERARTAPERESMPGEGLVQG